jgi:hypothetical protein
MPVGAFGQLRFVDSCVQRGIESSHAPASVCSAVLRLILLMRLSVAHFYWHVVASHNSVLGNTSAAAYAPART